MSTGVDASLKMKKPDFYGGIGLLLFRKALGSGGDLLGLLRRLSGGGLLSRFLSGRLLGSLLL